MLVVMSASIRVRIVPVLNRIRPDRQISDSESNDQILTINGLLSSIYCCIELKF